MNISLQRICVWAAVLFVSGIIQTLSAQDIHFSQFYNSSLNLNPGLTGVHGGDVRIGGNFRQQWESVPVPYLTFSGMYETRIKEDTRKNGYFSGAVLFNYDRAGDAKLSMTNFGLSGSYSTQLSEKVFLTGGAQLMLNQRAFRTDDLRFGDQFNGESFDPTLPQESFTNTNNFYADLSLGGNVRFQMKNANRWKRRSKLDVGVGLFHLNRPQLGFYDSEDIKLPIRVSIYAMGMLMVSPAFDIVLNGSVQLQNPYQENVFGAGGRIHLNRKRTKEAALQLGASYRFNRFGETTLPSEKFGDAIIPNLELHFTQWRFGASYDINISDFSVATENRGGPEFSVQYLIYKVKPLPQFKICPII
ncbi:MAG: PorP/SprF family type IX secretion system membrane protein [Saprospiraceae bacterium]